MGFSSQQGSFELGRGLYLSFLSNSYKHFIHSFIFVDDVAEMTNKFNNDNIKDKVRKLVFMRSLKDALCEMGTEKKNSRTTTYKNHVVSCDYQILSLVENCAAIINKVVSSQV